MNIGNVSILDLRVGGIPVQSAYDGEHLVWTRESPTGDYWGLCFTAKEANSTVSMAAQNTAPAVTLEYSTNANDWSPFTVGSTTVTLANIGDKVWLRAGSGGNQRFCSTSNRYNNFVLTGKVAASGNIMSILDGEQQLTNIPATYCFANLFFGCTSLVTPPELPATSLANYCYSNMFGNCTSLSVAPELPATTLSQRCYDLMFLSCTSLSVAPELPATSLAQSCYDAMFVSCYSLTQAPQLPGNIVNGAYASMFRSCINLQTPPSAVLGTSIPNNGCIQMFEDCSSLTSMPEIYANNAVDGGGMYHMFYRCSNLTETTPIRVTQTNSSGMNQMFYGCSKLSSIEVEFTNWPNTLWSWVYNVASNGIFYCPAALGTNETIIRGTNNCPANWTVVNKTYFRYSDGTTYTHDINGTLTRQAVLDSIEQDNQTSGALRYVDIGSDVTAVAPSAFSDWSYLKGIVIGENVEILDDNAFRRDASISSITFAGDSLTAIGPYAFAGVQNTGRYDLPEGLQTIGNNAFVYGGSAPNGLSVVSIPSTVTSIGGSAFSNSTALLSVIFNGKTMDEVTAMTNYPWGANGKIFVN